MYGAWLVIGASLNKKQTPKARLQLSQSADSSHFLPEIYLISVSDSIFYTPRDGLQQCRQREPLGSIHGAQFALLQRPVLIVVIFIRLEING